MQFFGAEGPFFGKHLAGNSDIRDYLFGEYTNNINNTITVNVFSAESGIYDEVRLDMQRFVLPLICQTQTL